MRAGAIPCNPMASATDRGDLRESVISPPPDSTDDQRIACQLVSIPESGEPVCGENRWMKRIARSRIAPLS